MELGKYKLFPLIEHAAFTEYSPYFSKTCTFGFVYQQQLNLKTKE